MGNYSHPKPQICFDSTAKILPARNLLCEAFVVIVVSILALLSFEFIQVFNWPRLELALQEDSPYKLKARLFYTLLELLSEDVVHEISSNMF